MKHFYKAFGLASATVFTAILTFGIVLPSLISAKSDIAVLIGSAGILASGLAVFELGRMTIKNFKKYKETSE